MDRWTRLRFTPTDVHFIRPLFIHTETLTLKSTKSRSSAIIDAVAFRDNELYLVDQFVKRNKSQNLHVHSGTFGVMQEKSDGNALEVILIWVQSDSVSLFVPLPRSIPQFSFQKLELYRNRKDNPSEIKGTRHV